MSEQIQAAHTMLKLLNLLAELKVCSMRIYHEGSVDFGHTWFSPCYPGPGISSYRIRIEVNGITKRVFVA